MAEDGIGIKQALRRVFMHAVAGIDDGNLQVAREYMRRSRRWMAHNNAVRAERLQRFTSVDQRFAFFNTGGRGADHRGMRPQHLGGKFKRDARPSRRFIEEKRDALAAKQWFRLAGMHTPGQLKK